MDYRKLVRLYTSGKVSEIEKWIGEQSKTEANQGTISFMLLCAAILMRKKSINGIKIDNKYLKSRATELDDINYSVWHWLAFSGNYDALKQAIVNNDFDPSTLKNDGGYTVWHSLASSGNYDALKQAIDNDDFDPSTLKNNIGHTIWHSLAFSGNYDALKQAIDNDFNPSTLKNKYGYTVWHSLASSGNYDALKQAIDNDDFDPSTLKNNIGHTIWHSLAFSGNYDALKQAIDNDDFDPSTLRDNSGYSVWHFLAQSGDYESLIQAIKQKGFDPGAIDIISMTSVWYHLALSYNYAAFPAVIKGGYITGVEALRVIARQESALGDRTIKHVESILKDPEITIKADDLSKITFKDPKIQALVSQFKQNMLFETMGAKKPSVSIVSSIGNSIRGAFKWTGKGRAGAYDVLPDDLSQPLMPKGEDEKSVKGGNKPKR